MRDTSCNATQIKLIKHGAEFHSATFTRNLQAAIISYFFVNCGVMYQHRNTNASVGNSTDYYVDNKTGFVTPQLPLQRLRGPWKVWEATLQVARSQRLKTAGQSSLLDAQQKAVEVEKSQAWRKSVEKVFHMQPYQ